jgi:hypothetical protein
MLDLGLILVCLDMILILCFMIIGTMMNERIREFEKQSGIEIYGLGRDRAKWEHCLEKFAKMIIEDCIGIIHTNDRIPKEFFYPKGAEIHASTINRHFGVEE